MTRRAATPAACVLALTTLFLTPGTGWSQEAPYSNLVRSWFATGSSSSVRAPDVTADLIRSVLRFGRSDVPPAAFRCPVPDRRQRGRDFVFDPASGGPDGDGSADRPFGALSEALAARKTARDPFRLKAGDRLLLRTGSHGKVTVPDLGNDGFVTIEAAPGAKPVIETLRVVDAHELVFQGIAFTAGGAADDRWLAVISPAASSIVLRDNRFATQDTAGWSDGDWAQRSRLGVFSRGRCGSITGNTFADLYGGVRSAGDEALIAGNRFEGIVNDNLTFETGRQWILGNAILPGRNSLDNPLHSDGIQGWSADKGAEADVVIDGNLVLHYQPQRAAKPDPQRVVAGQKMTAESGVYRQGISIFDGHWSRVRISGNVVVTNASHAVSMLGLTDSTVTDNVVLSSDPSRVQTRLRVVDGKDGTPTDRTEVRGNLVQELEVATRLPPGRNTILVKLVQNTASRDRSRPRVAGGPPARWGGVAHVAQDAFVRDVDGAANRYDFRPR